MGHYKLDYLNILLGYAKILSFFGEMSRVFFLFFIFVDALALAYLVRKFETTPTRVMMSKYFIRDFAACTDVMRSTKFHELAHI